MFKKPGKITCILDGQFGSTGKGKLAAWLAERHGPFQFACNAFSTQAAHWVRLSASKKFLYRHLNSMAWNTNLFEQLYIGPGAVLDVPTLLREVEENALNEHKVKIHPAALVVQQQDIAYELGLAGFDQESRFHHGTIKAGSTCSGVGAAAARRALRGPSVVLARDVKSLQPFLADTPRLILARLERGESGLGEISQGFGLSNMHEAFYPHVTYRNVTVSQFLSDMFLPPRVAGPVVINFRTYPIRINSNKYVGRDGRHLTWAEVQAEDSTYSVIEGDSGGWYPDQHEVNWAHVQQYSGAPHDLTELTSKTQLPRRVATFSRENLFEAMALNDCGHGVHLGISFADHVDYSAHGQKTLTPKVREWLIHHTAPFFSQVSFVSTGPLHEHMVQGENGYALPVGC